MIREDIIKKVTESSKQFEGYGMLWWLDHETVTFRVDDDIIKPMVEAGVPPEFIAKAELLLGDHSRDDFFIKVREIFGANPREAVRAVLPAHLEMQKIIYGGNLTYRADGYLGNYIFVDPRTGIVALRMTSVKSATDQSHFFPEFIKMAGQLTD